MKLTYGSVRGVPGDRYPYRDPIGPYFSYVFVAPYLFVPYFLPQPIEVRTIRTYSHPKLIHREVAKAKFSAVVRPHRNAPIAHSKTFTATIAYTLIE